MEMSGAKLGIVVTSVEDYRNAPTSIQVVGRRQHDEEVANLASYIDAVVNGK
jgi:amidase